MGNKNSRKKKLVLDSELNKKIANILILKADTKYSSKLRLNRSKTRNEDNSSSNSLITDHFNSNLKYRIRSRSKTKEKKGDLDNSKISKEQLEPEILQEDLEFLNLTNRILEKLFSLNAPFNGNSMNFYNSYFYNNIYKENKDKDKDISLNDESANNGNRNVDLKKSFTSYRRQSSITQGVESQTEYNMENVKILSSIFNVRKIFRENLHREENLDNSFNNSPLIQSGNYRNNNNNILNNSLINNLTTSFNLGDSFIRMKSDEKLMKNSINISPSNNNLNQENNFRTSEIDKDTSQFFLNASHDNANYSNDANNIDYFNEDQSQIAPELLAANNEKSILDKTNPLKTSNYYNNEFDFYVEDELKNKGKRENRNGNNANDFSRLDKTNNYSSDNSSPNKSKEKNPKPYKKRVYTKPPVVHVKMNLKDFIKDEVQEQSFYKQHPEYSREIEKNKSKGRANKNNNNNNHNQTNRDMLYDTRKIQKMKLNNTHLNNRSFVEVIEKFSQAKEYKQKLNERQRLKDIDYNHSRAQKRADFNHDFNEKIIRNYDNTSGNNIGKSNNSRIIDSDRNIKQVDPNSNFNKIQEKRESNFIITREIERDKSSEKYLSNNIDKRKSNNYSSNSRRESSRENSNIRENRKRISSKIRRVVPLRKSNKSKHDHSDKNSEELSFDENEIEYSPEFNYKEANRNSNNRMRRSSNNKNYDYNQNKKSVEEDKNYRKGYKFSNNEELDISAFSDESEEKGKQKRANKRAEEGNQRKYARNPDDHLEEENTNRIKKVAKNKRELSNDNSEQEGEREYYQEKRGNVLKTSSQRKESDKFVVDKNNKLRIKN